MYSNAQKWIESVRSLNFKGLDEEIKTGINVQDRDCNVYVLKVLHQVAKVCCDIKDTNPDLGRSVYKVTICLIPYTKKFTDKTLEIVYFILQYLMGLSLYNESKKIYDLLLAYHPPDHKNFLNISKVWLMKSEALLSKLSPKFDSETYNTFLATLKQYFTIIRATNDEHCKYIFSALTRFVDTIKTLGSSENKKTATLYLRFLRTSFSAIQELSPLLPTQHPSASFEKMMWALEKFLLILLETDNLPKVSEVLDIVSPVFLQSAASDESCQRHLDTHLLLFRALLKPMEELNHSSATAIQNYVTSLNSSPKPNARKSASGDPLQPRYFLIDRLATHWRSQLKNKEFFVTHCRQILQLERTIVSSRKISQRTDQCSCSMDPKLCNQIGSRTKFASIVTKCLYGSFSQDACDLLAEALKEMAVDVQEMCSAGCALGFSSWVNVKSVIYNLGSLSECHNPDQSISLYCLICEGIANLEGDDKRDKEITLSHVLRRLGVVYYNLQQYAEAMAMLAFTTLFSRDSDNLRCSRLMYRLRQQRPLEFAGVTLVSSLRSNVHWIEGLGLKVDLCDQNLAAVSLKEIQCYMEINDDMTENVVFALREMEQLEEEHVWEYARGVVMLGLQVVRSQNRRDLTEFVERAMGMMERLEESMEKSCLMVSLEFCQFVNAVNRNVVTSKNEQELMVKLLKGNKARDDEEEDEDYVVPSFAVINIDHDTVLMSLLRKVLNKWRDCFLNNFEEVVQTWKPEYMLSCITLSGEYAKLYCYYSCEILAWKLALKLATSLDDKRAYVNIVSHLISARFIRNDWIERAIEIIQTWEQPKESQDVCTATLFRASLANYYFKINKQEEAISLLNEACQVPNITISNHILTCLQLMTIKMTNYNIFKPNASHSEYTYDMAMIGYGIINLKSLLHLSVIKTDRNESWPYRYGAFHDACLEYASRIDYLMHREAVNSLVHQSKICQSLACTLRFGMIIKELIIVDLNKTELNDCEVKLTALEELLGISCNQVKQPVKIKKPSPRFPDIPKSPIRDAGAMKIREGSMMPELPVPQYTKPGFLRHSPTCLCYKCRNQEYQSLVFACTALRAQFYAMKHNYRMAMQYFRGALKIRAVFAENEFKHVQTKDYPAGKSFWWSQRQLVEWLRFQLNLGSFYKTAGRKNRAVEIMREVIDICEKHQVKSHPIYSEAVNQFSECLFEEENDDTDCDIDAVSVGDLIEPEVVQPTFKLIHSPPRTTVPTSRLAVEMQKANLKRPVNPRKRSPKHFEPNFEPVKTTLQKTLEIKSPIKIYVDEASESVDSKTDKDYQTAKSNLPASNFVTTRPRRNSRRAINYAESPSEQVEKRTVSNKYKTDLNDIKEVIPEESAKTSIQSSEDSQVDMFEDSPKYSSQVPSRSRKTRRDNAKAIPEESAKTSVQPSEDNQVDLFGDSPKYSSRVPRRGRKTRRDNAKADSDAVAEMMSKLESLTIETNEVVSRRRRNLRKAAAAPDTVSEQSSVNSESKSAEKDNCISMNNGDLKDGESLQQRPKRVTKQRLFIKAHRAKGETHE